MNPNQNESRESTQKRQLEQQQQQEPGRRAVSRGTAFPPHPVPTTESATMSFAASTRECTTGSPTMQGHEHQHGSSTLQSIETSAAGAAALTSSSFCSSSSRSSSSSSSSLSLSSSSSSCFPILEASLDPVFQLDETGCIIQGLNQAAVNLFGWSSRDELLGKDVSNILCSPYAARHEEQMQAYLLSKNIDESGKNAAAASTNATTDSNLALIQQRQQVQAQRKNRSVFWIEWYVVKLEQPQRRRRRRRRRRRKQHHHEDDDHHYHHHHDTHHDVSLLFCAFARDLTKQIFEKEQIRHSQACLTTGIIDASLDPMFLINQRGIIQMVNQAAVDSFGWTREEFLSCRNISMICGAEHASKHNSYLERYLRTGECRAIGKKRHVPARRKDGSEFWIELGLTEVAVHNNKKNNNNNNNNNNNKRNKKIMNSDNDGNCSREDHQEEEEEERMFCGFIRDLTHEKEQEEELKRRALFTNKIIEGSQSALLVTDSDNIIQSVNVVTCNMFGWEHEDFIGNHISMIMSEKDSAVYLEDIYNYLYNNDNNSSNGNGDGDDSGDDGTTTTSKKSPLVRQREILAVRRDGTDFPAIVGLADGHEGPDGRQWFALFVLDISDQKELMKIQAEKMAVDVLLLNVMPKDIAERLQSSASPTNNSNNEGCPQNSNTSIADHYESAAVLFADIVGFTSMSSRMKPVDVVKMLNEIFTMFDALVDNYKLNKVKTIGDCYMATSIPPHVDHMDDECERICHFALDMLEAVHQYNQRSFLNEDIDIRVGINVGPVVAGVVGTKRLLYDLWGDAVNLASRMESSGLPGTIQVTKRVRDLSGDDLIFKSRGKIPVKGFGEIETYLLTKRLRTPKRLCGRPT